MAVSVKLNKQAVLDAVESESDGFLTCLCGKVARKAKDEFVPVLTGNLKRSIRAITGSDMKRVYAGGGKVSGTPVEYAGFVELGTSKQMAQPFLRPAVDEINDNDIEDCGRN